MFFFSRSTTWRIFVRAESDVNIFLFYWCNARESRQRQFLLLLFSSFISKGFTPAWGNTCMFSFFPVIFFRYSYLVVHTSVAGVGLWLFVKAPYLHKCHYVDLNNNGTPIAVSCCGWKQPTNHAFVNCKHRDVILKRRLILHGSSMRSMRLSREAWERSVTLASRLLSKHQVVSRTR